MKSQIRNPICQRGLTKFQRTSAFLFLSEFGVRVSAFINIYFDHRRNPHYHGAIKSTDMKAWQDVSSSLTFLEGIRHGTVLPVPESVV